MKRVKKIRAYEKIKGLYAVTPDELDTEELLRCAKLALLGGARVLQYRNKAADKEIRTLQSFELLKLAHEFSVPLIINDDAELAKIVGADGVHLGMGDGNVSEVRKLLGNDKLIGVSCYNRMSLASKAVQEGADYVAFGSFFVSIVKPGAVSATPELLRQARQEIAVPVVAIGGITAQNASLLLDAGANALAVISAVFRADDIQGAAREFAVLNFH